MEKKFKTMSEFEGYIQKTYADDFEEGNYDFGHYEADASSINVKCEFSDDSEEECYFLIEVYFKNERTGDGDWFVYEAGFFDNTEEDYRKETGDFSREYRAFAERHSK